MTTRTLIPMLVLVPLFACHPRSDMRDVGEYQAVDNRTNARMRLDATDPPPLGEIKIADRCTQHVDTTLDEDGTLVITGDAGQDCVISLDSGLAHELIVRGSGAVDATGHWDGLETIVVRGDANIDIQAVTADHLDLTDSGEGDLEIRTLDAGNLHLDLSGGSDVTLAGECDDAQVTMDGSARLHARDLMVHNLQIVLNGASDAEISADGAVDASAGGSATLDVYGGQVSTTLLGNGQIVVH